MIDEIGLGSTTIKLPITKWFVHIAPKAPPNRYTIPLRVTVGFSWGRVSAEDFDGPEHPQGIY